MARKRKAESDDDDYSEEGTSYQPKRKRTNATQKKTPRQNKGKGKSMKRDASDAEFIDGSNVDPSEIVQTRPHVVSLHVVSHAQPLRDDLLRWYEGVHAARGMPWRKPYDSSWNAEEKAQRAYEVWVSEIMLQQTQVATVIPYYNKWMEIFPTIQDLAASDIDTVNGLWKGLGYYSRAARLLSGARKAMEEFGGRLPDNAKGMESKIPGIGRYSAGAICSIAYNERVPVLDGNVHRLLSRLLALHAPPKAKQTLDILWAGASALVQDADRPGDLNQALIELGSTVCKTERKEDELKGAKYATFKGPAEDHAVPDIEELCTLCEPVPVGCSVTAYPMKAEKKKAREELDIVNVIEWRKSVDSSPNARWFLLVRRPEGGLLAGLHEFPTAPNIPVTTSPAAQIEIVDTLLSVLLVSPPPPARSSGSDAQSEGQQNHASQPRRSKPSRDGPDAHGVRVTQIIPAGDVLHIFSHIRKTYRVQWVVLEGGTSNEPPPLVPDPEGALAAVTGAAMPKTSKGKPSRKHRTGAISSQKTTTEDASKVKSPRDPPPSGQTTQWVLLDAVADANIGTGVMKVWRQVRTLWESEDRDSSIHDSCDD